jgi:hypothetical protein
VPVVSVWELATGLVLGVGVLIPLLVYGPFDIEDVGLGVFSSQVHYKALSGGHWPFWLNDLGFGSPMPIGQRLDAHPVFAFGSLISLRVALTAVWVTHVAVMVLYFLRIAAVSGLGPPLRLILLACYLSSVPFVFYFYTTDWVSVATGWTLLPALVFEVHRLVLGDAVTDFWRAALRLALLGSLWILNTHPGYLAPLAVTLAIYALALGSTQRRAYQCLLVASALCAAASAERIYFTLTEASLFPPSLQRLTQPGFRLMEYLTAALVPLVPTSHDLRQPFIGAVLGLAAVIGIVRPSTLRDPHRRACAVAFVAALLFSLTPVGMAGPMGAFSGFWLFRDPMLFFGVLTGGSLLQAGLGSRRVQWTVATLALLGVQLAQQGVAIWPGLDDFWRLRGSLGFYQHQRHPIGLARILVDRATAFGPRLYVSEEAWTRLRGGTSAAGIHNITDLVFLGLNPINGWFKNVSMDRLYPSPYLMHGYIRSQREVLTDRSALDVLGVNLVLTTEGERAGLPPLVETDRFHADSRPEYSGRSHDFVVLGNPDAWPPAVLLPPSARDLALPLRPGCSHAGALCRDYAPLATSRLPDRVSLEKSDGRYVARFESSEDERILLLTVFYRPEWRAASSAGPLAVTPVADAFISVAVPPGVDTVSVAFRPRARIVLAWVSGLTLTALVGALAVMSVRRHRT